MGLTNREKEVFYLAVKGFQNKQIAKELGLSPETIKTHLKSITVKVKLPRSLWWSVTEVEESTGVEFKAIGFIGLEALTKLKNRTAISTTLTRHRAFEDDVILYVRSN